MKDDELVKDYSARMMDVVNQMRPHGEVMKDQKVVEKMMISVPPKFEAKISAIEESCDLDTLTVSELTIKMKTYLKSQGLRKVVEADESTPALGENPAVAYKFQAQEQRVSITSDENVEGAFRESSRSNKGSTSQNYSSTSKKDDELVKDYSARMIDVVNQMRPHGEVMKDQKVVKKMMISVPPKFEAKISAIEESCDLDTLTVSELTSK
nr:hypothetical protein [Tanacetum cinerariifolium]